MKNILCYSLLLLISFGCSNKLIQKQGVTMAPPIVAPFEGLDKLAVNDWWNRPPNNIVDLKVNRNEVIAFGIYTCLLYTSPSPRDS